ncbi:MAG: alpha/beta fold hydrolase [Candidatus Geothermincolales bacterium]
MEYSDGFAEVNGIEIYYRRYGSGDPVLLIQGLGANSDWWDERFLGPLASRFSLVAFDNRGAGRTTRAPGPYTIAQMADDAAALMDHLQVRSAHVLGVSMGGMIAQELALRHPEKVRKLALLVTNCGGREQVLAKPEVYQMLYAGGGDLDPRKVAEATLFLLFPEDFIRENPGKMEEFVEVFLKAPISPECFRHQLQAIMGWSSFHRLGDISAETLVITGSEDILIPPENSRILAEAIPNARLVEFPGAGHGLIAQIPEEVSSAVLAFFSG